MERFQHKTRWGSEPHGKTKVYFCGRDKDFNRFFKSVSDDILKTQDCAVWYSYDMVERDEEFLACLKEMQLFVIPVTAELLQTPNYVLDVEFPFAREQHIPVLPIMQEQGLQDLFNERCGELQYLERFSTDDTAICYEDKLKKYLSEVLISNNLAAKIRAAFDAYVFLSYRKKDRRFAQELMRLIHQNEFCRDIAIWYDEFLTPGENFNETIKAALQKSGLFVLAVTPNLVNETNYIMTTEYPLAQEAGKPILPAELVPTDRAQLQQHFAALPEPTDAHNERELSEALMDAVQKMAIRENDHSPEHNFFIGLAYLGGIDVEVDYPRALELITGAAESGLEEAMQKLVDIYANGIGAPRDYEKACYWKNRCNQHLWKKLQGQFDELASREADLNAIDLSKNSGNRYVYSEAKKALAYFRTRVGGAVKEWCEKQTELSEMYRRFNLPEKAKEVLIQTILRLEENPFYDVTNIDGYEVISEPNATSFNRSYPNLFKKLIGYCLEERKYSLAEEWRQRLSQWTAAVTERYGPENLDVGEFTRELSLLQADFLERQGKPQEAVDLLNAKVQEVVALIQKARNTNTSDMTAEPDENGGIRITGGSFGDFLEIYMRMHVFFAFFCESFFRISKINRKRGLIQETFDAYDEVVTSNRWLKRYHRDSLQWEILGKLGMAEYALRLEKQETTDTLMKEVEERLLYSQSNSPEMDAYRREYYATAAEIALLRGEDTPTELFEQAITLAEELVKEAPNHENLSALIHLYERAHAVCPRPSYTEGLKGLIDRGLLRGKDPARRALQAESWLLLYRMTEDPAPRQKAAELYRALSMQYPEERGFAEKRDGLCQ